MIYVNALLDAIQLFMIQHMTLFVVVCLFILIDIVSGLIVALVDGNYNSTEFRKGLARKLGYVLVMCAVAVIQVAMFDSNFEVPFDFPFFALVCSFIILLEFTSILENACKLNPKLDAFLGKYINGNDER